MKTTEQATTTYEFWVKTDEQGIVLEIGKSIIYQPKTNWNGKGIKWLNDSKYMNK